MGTRTCVRACSRNLVPSVQHIRETCVRNKKIRIPYNSAGTQRGVAHLSSSTIFENTSQQTNLAVKTGAMTTPNKWN